MNYRLLLKTLRNAPAGVFLLCAFGGSSLHAQEVSRAQRESSRGNAVTRIFAGDYSAPTIRGLDTRNEESLDGLIREGKLKISQADAVRLALENNVDINVERYNPYFSLWGIDKGRGVLNPSIEFKSNVNRLVTPSTSVLQGGDTLLNLNSLYDLTIKKPFEKGVDVEVNFNTKRLRSSSFFTSLNPSLAPALSFTLTQHLLKDFGGISRGRNLRIAQNTYNMSEEDFIKNTTDIIVNVLNAYWDLVYSEEDIKVKEASKKLAEVVLNQNKIQAEVGTMSPLDVVQAEAEVATRQEQLVEAQYNRRITEDQLKKLISSRLDPGIIGASVEPVSRPDPPSAPASDLTQAIGRALEIRPEVKRLFLDLQNKKIQVDYSKNQLRPSLDLEANFSQNGLGGVRIARDYSQGFIGAPVTSVIEGGFWDSMDSFFSRKYLGYVVGFTLKIPIGNDEAKANNAQAQIDYKQVEERIRSQKQKIALEVREAYGRVAMNQAKVAAAEVTVRYNEKRLQGEQDKYSVGATTTRFILEAQRDLRDSQGRLLKAKIDLIKNRIAVDKAVGDIFAAYNIELKDSLRLFK